MGGVVGGYAGDVGVFLIFFFVTCFRIRLCVGIDVALDMLTFSAGIPLSLGFVLATAVLNMAEDTGLFVSSEAAGEHF